MQKIVGKIVLKMQEKVKVITQVSILNPINQAINFQIERRRGRYAKINAR